MKILILLLAATLFAPLAVAATTSTPAVTVDDFHAALLDNMKRGPALGCGGRISNMNAAVDSSFDLPYLAQRILRKRWSELSEAQRSKFVNALQEMVVTTYATQFSDFSGESFSTQTTEDSGANRVVHSKFRHGNENVSFDYVLRDSGGHWRIVNVIAEGVSDLAIRSSQYESLFKQKGFDGLLAHLQEQIAKNKTGC